VDELKAQTPSSDQDRRERLNQRLRQAFVCGAEEVPAMAKHQPKYGPLSRHRSAASHPTTMPFAEMSGSVGGLPASAYRDPAWWANDPTHVQARAWLDVGLRVETVDLDRQIVGFCPGGEDGGYIGEFDDPAPSPL
jgi:hypothetical protein